VSHEVPSPFPFTWDNVLLPLAIGHHSYFQVYKAIRKIKTQITESPKLQIQASHKQNHMYLGGQVSPGFLSDQHNLGVWKIEGEEVVLQ